MTPSRPPSSPAAVIAGRRLRGALVSDGRVSDGRVTVVERGVLPNLSGSIG